MWYPGSWFPGTIHHQSYDRHKNYRSAPKWISLASYSISVNPKGCLMYVTTPQSCWILGSKQNLCLFQHVQVGRNYSICVVPWLDYILSGTALGEVQNGFRKGRSGSDCSFILNTILWKSSARRKLVHLSFLDLQKAWLFGRSYLRWGFKEGSWRLYRRCMKVIMLQLRWMV